MAIRKTIGMIYGERNDSPVTGEIVRLMLWDTAGQENVQSIDSNYYKGSGAALFVFSTTDRESFLELPRWQAKVREEVGTLSVLVPNKVDLITLAPSPQQRQKIWRET